MKKLLAILLILPGTSLFSQTNTAWSTSANIGIGTTTVPTGRLEIVNTSGGYTAANYLQITGTTSDNLNYPGISFKGGTYLSPGKYPEIRLGNGGLALYFIGGEWQSKRLYMGFSSTYGILMGDLNGQTNMIVAPSGNILMKNTADITEVPTAKLHVVGLGSTSATSSFKVDNSSGSNQFIVQDNGNVGIGTSIPSAKLTVKGDIVTTKVKVTGLTNIPDYVFEKSYKLPTIAEVEQFIKQNKHLPGIPSAKEVATDNLDLGENQMQLLKKIEELTLYIIQLNKKIEEQDKKLNSLIK